jgi:hypothetical protein
MPANGMNVGTDFSFGLYDANSAQTLPLGDVESIKETAQKHDISSRRYNAPPRYGYVPDGYSGTFTITRTGSQMEQLQIQLSNNFNNGVPVLSGYINKIVTDAGPQGVGITTKYQYTGVCFFLSDIGDISREKTVKQTIVWMASDKQQLA